MQILKAIRKELVSISWKKKHSKTKITVLIKKYKWLSLRGVHAESKTKKYWLGLDFISLWKGGVFSGT